MPRKLRAISSFLSCGESSAASLFLELDICQNLRATIFPRVLRSKIKWAEQHIEQLQSTLHRFLKSGG